MVLKLFVSCFLPDITYKESAYVHALSLAVITHSVARGCAENVLPNCSSQAEITTTTSTNTNYIEYGLSIAEEFLNKRYSSTGGGSKQEMVHHNFQATKLVSVFCIHIRR